MTITLPNAQTVEFAINHAWLTKSEKFLRSEVLKGTRNFIVGEKKLKKIKTNETKSSTRSRMIFA